MNIPSRLSKYAAARYRPPAMPPRKKANAIKLPLPSIQSFCCWYLTMKSYGFISLISLSLPSSWLVYVADRRLCVKLGVARVRVFFLDYAVNLAVRVVKVSEVYRFRRADDNTGGGGIPIDAGR